MRMARSKSCISRIFLLSEVGIFLTLYFCGKDGLPKLYRLLDENIKLEAEISLLNKEISSLENEMLAWHNDPFYKEKVAREQLQMAREYDEIFFIQ
jgi:cell division protein FtsB